MLTLADQDVRPGASHGGVDGARSRLLAPSVKYGVGALDIGEVNGAPGSIRFGDTAPGCHGLLELAVQVSGRCTVSQDGREARLVPGDFAIIDTRLPYQFSFGTNYKCVVLMVAPDLIPVKPADLRRLTARRVAGHAGVGQLASQLLCSVAQQASCEDLRANHELSSAVINMVTAALTSQSHCVADPSVDDERGRLLRRVKAFIEARLRESDLTSTEIARANHISLRYLQKLFEAEGTTVSDWVRVQRLERCRSELCDPRYGDASISLIAMRWGFADSAYFSRVFKAAYGLAPRAYRAAAISV